MCLGSVFQPPPHPPKISPLPQQDVFNNAHVSAGMVLHRHVSPFLMFAVHVLIYALTQYSTEESAFSFTLSAYRK